METNTDISVFEEDNYSEYILILAAKIRKKHHRDSRQIHNIHRISNINTLNVSSYMGKFFCLVNAATNVQGRLYMDVCAIPSIFFLNENLFTKVSMTLRSVAPVGFNKAPQSLPMAIESGAAAVYLPNVTTII